MPSTPRPLKSRQEKPWRHKKRLGVLCDLAVEKEEQMQIFTEGVDT
jgi:hypothetical protein